MIRRILSLLKTSSVRGNSKGYILADGLRLPPVGLRFGGEHFRKDCDFLSAGRYDVERLVKLCGLTDSSSLLEVGCGPGRLPIGLLQVFKEFGDYTGLDVNKARIDWCKEHIQDFHPGMSFHHIDIENARYNPKGVASQMDYTIPVDAGQSDCIYLYSVFSHLMDNEVNAYLSEFSRVLRAAGKIFLTAFVSPHTNRLIEENPSDFGPLSWHGPLHCVLYQQEYFETLLGAHGFVVDNTFLGTETDGQTLYIVSKL